MSCHILQSITFSSCIHISVRNAALFCDKLFVNVTGNFKRVGIILQRSILISGLVAIPIICLFWFADKILLMLKQDPDIVTIAGVFTRLDKNHFSIVSHSLCLVILLTSFLFNLYSFLMFCSLLLCLYDIPLDG
jgi:hypothetical protein